MHAAGATGAKCHGDFGGLSLHGCASGLVHLGMSSIIVKPIPGDIEPGSPFRKGYDPRRHTGGRTPKEYRKIHALARSYSTEAIEKLVELMRGADDERIQCHAAEALLDRAWGKPATMVAVDATGAPTKDAQALLQLFRRLAGEEPDAEPEGMIDVGVEEGVD